MKINRNIFFAERFVTALVQHGVRDVIISPGSRSTSLVYAFAANKKVKAISILDERAAGFFATGLSRSSGRPVALLCTSGTASVEYYPAIVEAYQQRIPLIVCTSDRPEKLRGTGANQTIDQFDLYHNHICSFTEFQVEKPNIGFYRLMYSCVHEMLEVATKTDPGPVHFNIGMDKPFEPDKITDSIDPSKYATGLLTPKKKVAVYPDRGVSKKISQQVKKYQLAARFPVIVVGPGEFSSEFRKKLNAFSLRFHIPVFIDVASGLRFGTPALSTGLVAYEHYLGAFSEQNKILPDLVYHFGRYPTSKALDNFLKKSRGMRIMTNRHGDRFDPNDSDRLIIGEEPETILSLVNQLKVDSSGWEVYYSTLQRMEEAALKHSQTLLSGKALTELNVIARFVEEIPPDSQLFLSNSLTIRDCDRILPLYKKNIQVFQNRGASGIDGIIASALGVAADSKLDTYLIIGDLAFIYDLPAIHIASLLGINLKILLLNNNGGRIFDHLPSSQFGEVHEKYFLTRQKVVVEQVVRGYGAGYMGCKSAGALLAGIKQLKSAKRATVLEVKIDNARSMKQRKLFAGK